MFQNVHVGEGGIFFCILHFHGIGVVDAVNFCRFENGIGFDFHGAQRRGGVGREIRIAGASGEDNDPSFFEVADGAATDERLGNLIHLDGGLHASKDFLFFKGILQCQRVDDGCQHSHVIGGDAIHVAGLVGYAAEKIASAHNDCHLDAEGMHVGEFGRDFMNAGRVNAEALRGG